MAVVDIAAGEDDLGHIAVPLRQNPARDDLHERLESGSRKNGGQLL